MRDRGFLGRSLLVGDGAQDEMARQAAELGADGALPATPPEDLARRFQAALAARKRVLIVDDSEIVARLLTRSSSRRGSRSSTRPTPRRPPPSSSSARPGPT